MLASVGRMSWKQRGKGSRLSGAAHLVERNVVVTVNVRRTKDREEQDLLLSHIGFGNVLAEQVLELAFVQARIAVLVELLEFAEERVVVSAHRTQQPGGGILGLGQKRLVRGQQILAFAIVWLLEDDMRVLLQHRREHGELIKVNDAVAVAVQLLQACLASQLRECCGQFLRVERPVAIHLQKSATTHGNVNER